MFKRFSRLQKYSPDSGRVNRPRFFRKENTANFALLWRSIQACNVIFIRLVTMKTSVPALGSRPLESSPCWVRISKIPPASLCCDKPTRLTRLVEAPLQCRLFQPKVQGTSSELRSKIKAPRQAIRGPIISSAGWVHHVQHKPTSQQLIYLNVLHKAAGHVSVFWPWEERLRQLWITWLNNVPRRKYLVE